MWRVFEFGALTDGIAELPLPVLKRYEIWKSIVVTSGPSGLVWIEGLRDAALFGTEGEVRASCLGLMHRVVYEILSDERRVRVTDIAVSE